MVWVEYESSILSFRDLRLINRGHTGEKFEQAVLETRKRGLTLSVHVILGLPGEGLQKYWKRPAVIRLDIQGLKIDRSISTGARGWRPGTGQAV